MFCLLVCFPCATYPVHFTDPMRYEYGVRVDRHIALLVPRIDDDHYIGFPGAGDIVREVFIRVHNMVDQLGVLASQCDLESDRCGVEAPQDGFAALKQAAQLPGRLSYGPAGYGKGQQPQRKIVPIVHHGNSLRCCSELQVKGEQVAQLPSNRWADEIYQMVLGKFSGIMLLGVPHIAPWLE